MHPFDLVVCGCDSGAKVWGQDVEEPKCASDESDGIFNNIYRSDILHNFNDIQYAHVK